MSIKTKKSLGQNFLTEATVINQIIRAINPLSHDNFLEIGPGKGAITKPLLKLIKNLHVVERFTRVSEGTVIWSATITDPEIYTQPFTISMPLTRDDEYVMYEYACHEGNYAIPNILSAGRAGEQQAQR